MLWPSRRWGYSTSAAQIEVNLPNHNIVADAGEGPGVPLIFRPTEARTAEKKFWGDPVPLISRSG